MDKSLDWCRLADWAPACKSNGLQFYWQSGHMPELQAGPQEGEHERQPHTDVSLPLFLPPFPFLFLKISK